MLHSLDGSFMIVTLPILVLAAFGVLIMRVSFER